MQKQFQNLAVGEIFTYNNKNYTKINTVKISCCKSVNCHAVSNPKDRLFIQPTTNVEVSN